MKHTKFALLICLTFGLSQFATAGERSTTADSGSFYIEETFFPVYVKKNDAQSSAGGSTTKTIPTESGLGYDFRTTMGYVWSNIVFGATFNYYSVNTSRPLTSDYEGLKTSTTKTDLGPTVGYVLGGWRAMFTYFIYATKTFHETYTDPSSGAVTTDNNYKNTDGSGFQFEITYGLNLGEGFSIGPTLIYRDVSYKKQSLSGGSNSYSASSTTSTPVDAELKPMVTLSFRF